ncbi:MAG: SPOR domain-containing protein, partial [Pseudomonadota bacterium]
FARLYKSGAPGIPAFTEDALEKIYSYSRGIPRLINNICDSSLLLGASERLTIIDAPLVTETIKSMPGVPMKPLMERGPAIPPREEISSGLEEEADEVPQEEVLKEEKDPRLLSLSGIDQEMMAPQRTKIEKRVTKRKPLFKALIIVVLLVLLFLAGAYLLNTFWDYGKSILSHKESPKRTTSREEIFRAPPKDVKKEETAKVQKDVSVSKEEPSSSPASSPQERGHQRELSTGILSTPENKIAPGAPKDEGTSLYPWSLHLGSYRSLEKAKEALSDLIRRGISSYLVKVDLGNKGMWWRVYGGYYKSQEEAQQIKKEFSLSDGLIVKTIYANYIGAFPSRTEMAPLADRLEKMGYYPYSINRTNGKSHLYIGAFAKRGEALEQNKNLLAEGIQSHVVRR